MHPVEGGGLEAGHAAVHMQQAALCCGHGDRQHTQQQQHLGHPDAAVHIPNIKMCGYLLKSVPYHCQCNSGDKEGIKAKMR